MLFSLGREWV